MDLGGAGDHVAITAVPAVGAALDVVDDHPVIHLQAPAVWAHLRSPAGQTFHFKAEL